MRRFFLCLAALLCLTIATPSASATNDFTPYQWALRQVHAQEGWQVSTGAGITVGVVDTGADVGHPDFGGRVSTVDCTNTSGSAANCRAGGEDIHGHGSHVTGIIAAANDGSGTAGVAPSANVLVARVFTCGGSNCNDPGATSEDVEAGIHYLLDRGVAAINMSLGDGGFLGFACDNTRFATLLNEIWSRGAVPVFAAGNCSGGILGGGADYSGVNALIVGATGPSGAKTSYTSSMASAQWGLLAPGGDGTCSSNGENCVLSTWPRDKSGGSDPYYLLQGTSMAAPAVTGAVAALRAKGLSKEGAVDAIINNLDAANCGAGCRGRLNLQRALGAPDLGSAPAPTNPPANGGFGGTGGNVNRTGSTRKASTPKATTPATAAPTTVAPETTTTEAPTTTTEPVSRPASRQQALKTENDDDGVAPLPAILGVAGLLAAAGATGLAQWRRSRGGAGL